MQQQAEIIMDGGSRTAMGSVASLPKTETVVVRDPARGGIVAELPIDDAAVVAETVERARAAQKAWCSLSAHARGGLLKRARREMVRDRAEILSLLDRETGKARVDTLGELLLVCLDIGYLARRARRALAPERRSARPFFGKRALVSYKPRGVVGIISPWNAPLNLALVQAVPALIAGNAVVIKPSELAPLAVQRAVLAMNRALPANVLQVLIGAGPTGAALVDHVDMICVTGSPETGRKVMERASRRLTPVLLELGGKDPMIVLRDADLERAANAAVWGSCFMSGQFCMSVERIYVEAPIAAEFTAKVVEKVGRLRFGPNGADADIDFGAFTNPPQIEIVERHVADARVKGAKVLTGGERVRSDTGLFYPPTVVTEVNHSMLLMREETFGPIIPIMQVEDAEEALRLANDSAYGLNASVWTRDFERGVELAKRVESGSVCVNEIALSAGCPDLPFGGVKQSGVGTRRGGVASLRHFCVPQAILGERSRRKRELAWFPYSTRQARLVDRILGFLFG